jgi:hypothetical protein
MGYREDDADNLHQDIEEIGGGGGAGLLARQWAETPPQPWVVARQRAGPKVDGARGRKQWEPRVRRIA